MLNILFAVIIWIPMMFMSGIDGNVRLSCEFGDGVYARWYVYGEGELESVFYFASMSEDAPSIVMVENVFFDSPRTIRHEFDGVTGYRPNGIAWRLDGGNVRLLDYGCVE